MVDLGFQGLAVARSEKDGGVLWIENGSKHEELMRVEVES